MPRPKTYDDSLRLRLLDRAEELLAGEGVKALSLRRLAADVGTSTTAVYSLFGGKPDLLNALYAEGFRRFGARLRDVVRTGDTVEDVVQLGLEYRAAALADRHLYPVMFTGAVPAFEPNTKAAELAKHALQPLRECIRSGVDAGVFAGTSPDVITLSCWGCAHGLVSLELTPGLAHDWDIDVRYERAIRANVDGWRRPHT